ncbi:polysaccharide pyruvyl transferase family protein, partial [Flavobacteriaceae bacterium]|nr:polysaccharide pyruvyl transferase family protein [Flavobacteriaceae bacterium]
AYFLIPFTSFNGKRFSYAACRGIKEVNKKDVPSLKIALENYNWVGVRDNQTQEFVQTNSNQIADVVCDPSMLISYKDLVKIVSPLAFKYIFVYVLGKEIDGGHLKVIKSIKSKVGNIKVVVAYLTNKNPNYFPWADVHLFDSSPIEWMNLIKHSEYFYTDSFHGLLFASKFEKRVLAFYAEKNRASRLLDIAKRLDLSNFIVSSYDEAIEKDSFNTILNNSNYEILSEKFISNSKEVFLSKILNS